MSMPVRILAVLVGLFLCLALAALAYGGAAAFLAEPAFLGLSAVTIAAGIAAVFAGGSLSPGVKEDRGNRWVLIWFTVLSLLVVVVPPWTDARGILVLGGGAALRWAGVALFAIGCALRLAPVFVLGSRFSGLVALQPGHRLETTGLYGRIRHPSYLGLLVATIGWALVFRSLLGLLVTAVLLVPLLARIRAEERFLAEAFGNEYEAYRARTHRLIPGIY